MRDLPPVSSPARSALDALRQAIQSLPTEQHLQQATCAVHAASHVATAGDGKLKPMVRDALPMIRDS
jgi:hypothetical protein